MTASDHPRPCPSPEVLYTLVEGAPGVPADHAIIAHLEGCRDCRFIVGETMEFLRQEAAKRTLHEARQPRHRWWLAAAAVIGAGVVLVWHLAREPERRFDRAVRQFAVRPVEGRLSGVPYHAYAARRGQPAPLSPLLAVLTNAVLSASPIDAPGWHRHGIASLLKGDSANAVLSMEKSTKLAPHYAPYWSDLAAARLAIGMERSTGPALEAAIQDAAFAISLDPTLQEGRFNLAIAYQRRGLTKEAAAAFDDYLSLDAASLWTAEARRRRENVGR